MIKFLIALNNKNRVCLIYVINYFLLTWIVLTNSLINIHDVFMTYQFLKSAHTLLSSNALAFFHEKAETRVSEQWLEARAG